MKFLRLVAALFLAPALPLAASVVDLTFEGLAPYPQSQIMVENFYNGGTDSAGVTGPNYGITFPSNALMLALNTTSQFPSNTSRGGLGDPNSQLGGLFFLMGTDTYLNMASGFTTGFSFNYSAINQGGAVGVWSGMNGTGTELAVLNLPTTPSNCPGYAAGFCPFYAAGVTFSGTAESIDFNGVANQIVFDDVTFGSSSPGIGPTSAVPEPAVWSLFGAGLVVIGFAGRCRR